MTQILDNAFVLTEKEVKFSTSDEEISSVDCTDSTCFFMTNKGFLYGWGMNNKKNVLFENFDIK